MVIFGSRCFMVIIQKCNMAILLILHLILIYKIIAFQQLSTNFSHTHAYVFSNNNNNNNCTEQLSIN